MEKLASRNSTTACIFSATEQCKPTTFFSFSIQEAIGEHDMEFELNFIDCDHGIHEYWNKNHLFES